MTPVNNVSKSLTYTEVTLAEETCSANATWTNWDLSATIGSDAESVDIHMYQKTGARESNGGCREDGSSRTYTHDLNRNGDGIVMSVKPVAGIIEIYDEFGATPDIGFVCIGYWS